MIILARLRSELRSWWKALFHGMHTDAEIAEELQFHIDSYALQLVEEGVPSKEAQRRARIEFGSVDVQKEKYRSAIGLSPLHEIGGDIRYGLRSLYRNWAVSLVAVLSLALGIGATTAIFSVIYDALLHPFPYAAANRIVNPALIDEEHPQSPTWFALTPSQFESFNKANSIESLLGFMPNGLTATGDELPEDVQAAYVTSNISSFLGVPARLGRGIEPFDVAKDKPPSNVVVLTYKYWQSKYDGDTGIVGHKLQLNHENYTIVGVMPRRFTFTQTVSNVDVYIPWTATRCPNVFPWIKLKPGVNLAAANAEFQSFIEQFKRETPNHFPASFQVSVQRIAEPYIHQSGTTLALLFASVVLLLLIGCANCSILLLARGESRQHELTIRTAIGASRFRIVRQLLVESFAISFAGAVIGVFASLWLARLPLQIMPNSYFPQEAAITVNLPILIFSVGLALFSGVLSGLYPALWVSRPNLSQMIQSTSRKAGINSGKRTLNILIGSQLAITFLLLGFAGAAIAGFLKITSTQLGYDPRNVMVLGIPLKRDTSKNRVARAADIDQVRETVSGVPGVVSAAVSMRGIPPSPPFGGIGTQAPFEILGASSQQQQLAALSLVSPEYFSTLKIPLLKGRLWDQPENRSGDFVVVVNQALAQRYWPNGDAIGHQIRVDSLKDDGEPLSVASPQSSQQRQIIGIVADSRNDGLERPAAPAIYVPYTAFMWDHTQLFIRTAGTPLASLKAVRTALHAVNSEQRTVTEVDDLEEGLQHQPIWIQQRLFSILFSFFGGLALALSLVGLASTVSFAIAQRTNEIGIRIALGAQRANVVWMIIRATLATVLCGIAGGLVLNLALERVLRHWMPGSVIPPWMLPGIIVMLITCATAACFLPARQAANIDPLQVLRCE
jgi:predicted permease